MTFKQIKLFEQLNLELSEEKYWEMIAQIRSAPSDEVFDKAFAMAAVDNEEQQIIGIHILSQLGDRRPYLRQTMKLFFQLLDESENEKVLSEVLLAIGHNNDDLSDYQISVLSNFKNHSNGDVKYGLSFALGGVEHPKAAEALMILTKDELIDVRNWAVFGLNLTDLDSEEIRTAFWERTTDEDQETKMEAIVGLAKRKAEGIEAIIEKELTQEDFGTLLFDAIEELGAIQFLPRLEQLFKKLEDDETVNADWMKALKRCVERLKLIN